MHWTATMYLQEHLKELAKVLSENNAKFIYFESDGKKYYFALDDHAEHAFSSLNIFEDEDT